MVSFRLTAELEQQLNRYSEQQEVSKSYVIKEALAAYFHLQKQDQEELSPYQLGENLFGRFSSNEENLSSNYKQIYKQKLKAKLRAKNFNR